MKGEDEGHVDDHDDETEEKIEAAEVVEKLERPGHNHVASLGSSLHRFRRGAPVRGRGGSAGCRCCAEPEPCEMSSRPIK
jgi:hypothetical protein